MGMAKNNHKETPGCKKRTIPLSIVLGFSVSAAKTDKDGKPVHNKFRAFVPVNRPDQKVDSRLPSRKRQKEKLKNWKTSIASAQKAADEMAKGKDFPCHVFPQILKTSTLIKSW